MYDRRFLLHRLSGGEFAEIRPADYSSVLAGWNVGLQQACIRHPCRVSRQANARTYTLTGSVLKQRAGRLNSKNTVAIGRPNIQ